MAVFGELLGRELGILYRFLHHLGLHGLEIGKFVLDGVGISAIDDGYSLFEKLALTRYDASDEFHLVARHGDDAGDVVAVALVVLAVLLGIQVDDNGRIDLNFIGFDTVADEETAYFLLCLSDASVEFGQTVAEFFRQDGPCYLVGGYLFLGESLHTHLTILVGKIVDSGLMQKPSTAMPRAVMSDEMILSFISLGI